ncbi:MAG: hypothetical protein AB7P03_03260 [Kofleriaceae bacterium]
MLDELRALAAGSASPVLASDLTDRLRFATLRHFGSIEAARFAAGIEGPNLARRWSKEVVIAELRRLHAEGVRITDLALKHDHGDLLGAIREYFDGLPHARRAAGLPEPPPLGGKRQRWTEERVVAEIEELHRSGESIAASKVPNPLLKAGKRYFGSWAAAVEASGFDYDEVRLQREPYTEDELIEELRSLAKARPEMRWSELYELSFSPALVRTFGSFEAALTRARLVDWPHRERLPAMSRTEVIAAIRRREREGKATNWEAVNGEDHHLWYSGVLHFGEWRVAAEAAGVDMSEHNRSWTPDALLDALRDRDQRGLSLKPADVKRDDMALYSSVVAYFGSYLSAVERVAFTPWATTRWTPELTIAELKRTAGGRRRVTATEAGSNLVRACQLHFGSYSAACKAAGLASVPRAGQSKPRRKSRKP